MGKLIITLTIVTIFAVQIKGQYDYNENSEDSESETETTTVRTTTQVTTPRNTSTLSPVHVNSQVNNILTNVNALNITGIVDQALGIRNNTPVRNLVNGILSSVFCNVFFANAINCHNSG